MTTARAGIMFLVGMSCICIGACDKGNLPTTYPVTGKVVFTNKKPLTGGGIFFRSEKDPDVRAVGEIGTDGQFTLYTISGKTKLVGAVEGEHKLEVVPPMDDKQQMIRVRILKEVVRVEARENEIVVEIEEVID
jgi:hypothetical protein